MKINDQKRCFNDSLTKGQSGIFLMFLNQQHYTRNRSSSVER